MQGILYEEASSLTFIFVTLLLGGFLALLTGRACAKTWRPRLVMAIYIAILTIGSRFIHFSIFGGTRQMVTQYYWLYEAAGPFSWKARG